ncbi:relaxase/mobilization nuclease domain-containing protein [Mucilaginibacter paludis]|uniref:Relaxase/mobilization nuclease family protein n=1 Tax=Mucilaginibacter paludis DSM 18603 TaxID=714943 RepID=H1YHN5_9SPHI|nr:relaxase/mobilization nuclease domain-containing protein [Mucilaginibacter paludis]EHQ26458.1 Relaxase/mobilization nuclease family protein [Mucilaginibacter paludis DSM 18603]
MIARILGKSSLFGAVNYNTEKMDQGKGELMLVANFGPLQGLDHLKPEDYKAYLTALAALNKDVAEPQFHATISAEGKSHDKQALTGIAVAWLAEMGYADQPYLIVFHNDTDNNHVHVVSVRVDCNGDTIKDSYEHSRSVRNINKVMGMDEKHGSKAAIEKALSYDFSTKAQFMMILESQGYVLREAGQVLEVIKFGKKQDEIQLAQVAEKLKAYLPDTGRQAQLKAILHKYAAIYDTELKPLTTPLPGGFNKATGRYTSELSAYLKAKMGIQLQFHAGEGKAPYGYTLIDHAAKTVWKGGEIIPLKELLALNGRETFTKQEPEVQNPVAVEAEVQEAGPETTDYYSALLKAALHNYPDLGQGLQHQGLEIGGTEEDPLLIDPPANTAIPVGQLLSGNDLDDFREQYHHHVYVPGIHIADDVDDQQIHGMRRRRQKKARTNTR